MRQVIRLHHRFIASHTSHVVGWSGADAAVETKHVNTVRKLCTYLNVGLFDAREVE